MNLNKIVISAGLFAFLAAPVFANEPTTASPTGDTATPAGEVHPDGADHHHKTTAKAKKKQKKAKSTTTAPTEGTTEAPAPAPAGN